VKDTRQMNAAIDFVLRQDLTLDCRSCRPVTPASRLCQSARHKPLAAVSAAVAATDTVACTRSFSVLTKQHVQLVHSMMRMLDIDDVNLSKHPYTNHVCSPLYPVVRSPPVVYRARPLYRENPLSIGCNQVSFICLSCVFD